jgi:hypothetical protein
MDNSFHFAADTCDRGRVGCAPEMGNRDGEGKDPERTASEVRVHLG